MLSITIPITIVSEANRRDCWGVKFCRKKKQREAVCLYLKDWRIKLPCQVRLTRLSPRKLDDDNLQCAMKTIRDAVADCIIRGLPYGRADGDPRITWIYHQEKAKEKGLKIEIF